MRLRLPILLLALALPAPAAAELIAEPQTMTVVSAHGGQAVWSEHDEAGYHLVRFDGRAARRVPLAPRASPFDVDLGAGPGGRLTAVYSRCTQGTSALGFSPWGAPWGGCDLYRFDFATGKERRIPGAASSRYTEYLPTVSGDRVAYIRLEDRYSFPPKLVVQSLSGTDKRTFRASPEGIIGLDLAGRRLAIARLVGYGTAEPHTTLSLAGTGTLRERRVARTRAGVRNMFVTPALRGDRLYAGLRRMDAPSELHTYDLRGRRLSRRRAPEPFLAAARYRSGWLALASAPSDGWMTCGTTEHPDGTCRVVRW
jgi:hypothetical protein